MTEREARIAFNLIPGFGSVKVEALTRAAGGDVVEAYRRLVDKRDWKGDVPDWRGEIARAEKQHVAILTACDALYPVAFRDLASPPLALYVAGDPAALAKNGVALVGTRRATAYGKDVAERMAFELAKAGWAVFSGLAMGVDAAAHRGALAGGGITAGILGGALDKFYPEANRSLAHEIVAAGGAVASEYPFGRSPDYQTFPQRNRLVAALARGVVAVEAPEKSGTLITCTQALELNRAVMAVPGRVDSPYSAGCLQLIREGACLVCNAADVLEEVNTLFAAARVAKSAPRAASHGTRGNEASPTPKSQTLKLADSPSDVLPISIEEAAVLRVLPAEGATIDVVARAAKLPVARVNVLLTGLRLKRKVKFLPGNRVIPG